MDSASTHVCALLAETLQPLQQDLLLIDPKILRLSAKLIARQHARNWDAWHSAHKTKLCIATCSFTVITS
jgi:hypothetical protein